MRTVGKHVVQQGGERGGLGERFTAAQRNSVQRSVEAKHTGGEAVYRDHLAAIRFQKFGSDAAGTAQRATRYPHADAPAGAKRSDRVRKAIEGKIHGFKPSAP